MFAALGNVIGGVAAVRGAGKSLKFIEGVLAFSAGFMLAVALVEILPEAYAENGGTSAAIFVLVGYMLVHLSQHTLTQHFHFGEEIHDVTAMAGITALVGLLIHTFFDGVAIASGFHAGNELGVLIFLAVLLHKLPEGVTISSLQMAAGLSPAKALASAAALGLATVAGALLTDSMSFLVTHGLALSAGVTIYVAASDLVPEFQHKKGWRIPVLFFAGAAVEFGVKALLAVASG